ncbi:MAG: DUF992 domain-containing protein [Pseudomonadota bacterium]
MSMIRAAILALFATSLFAYGAQAQTKAAVGNLTCTGGAGVGLILGSKKTYRCSFKPIDGGAAQTYSATVTKVGLDIGVTGNSVIVWSVLAAGPEVRQGFLAGEYAGVAADVALGVGGGAKVLVGGSSKSVVLQPLSVQGQTGVNLAVGVSGMKMQ